MRLFYSLCAAVLVLALVLSPDLVLSNSGGAPANTSGSPLSATVLGDCSACHGSFEVNSGSGGVTIDAPATFVPGETVTFTITVDNTTPPMPSLKQGFSVSVEDDAAEAHAGTLVIVDDLHTQFAGGDEHFVTHTAAGNLQTTWTVGWTAPEDAPASVTIYAAANAANGNFSPTGDYIYTTSEVMERETVSNEPEASPLAARLDALFPNPFAEAATVAYTLDRPMAVTLTLFDGVGRVVRVLEEGVRGAGSHAARVEADGLPAGVYFVQIRSEAGTEVRALTLAQ